MEVKKFLLRFPVVASLVVSLTVGSAIIMVRQLGWLEALELAVYDRMLSIRPHVATGASRVVLIAINEDDIRQQGQWPLTDATLAQVLQLLSQYRPRAIGVDLFRDLAIPPGEENLAKVLTENRNIIVVTKIGGPSDHGVPPPASLKNSEQVGFADVILDPGGIVRRGLLYLDAGEATATSFALRLALLSLRMEGITPQPDLANPDHLRLGQATIRPFEANDGGYIGADARGYQFLLDFHGAAGPFPSFSLMTLLTSSIVPEALRGKVVLIGVIADSVKDTLLVPYEQADHAPSIIPGVVLHAQMVSQLLSHALDGNPPITTLSEWHEWEWIFVWCASGAMLGLWELSVLWFALALFAGLIVLGASGYWAFVQSWWIPVVPPAVGWLLSANLLRKALLLGKKEVI